MVDITLQVSRDDVYKEVAQTTSYIGAKSGDESLYDRVFTTDEDQSMLKRFWDESKNTAGSSLKRVMSSETETDDGEFSMTLELPVSFDEALTGSITRALFSFFVMNITAKWLAFLVKEEASSYAEAAASHMDNILRMVFHRKNPERPVPICPDDYIENISNYYGE